MNLLDPTVIELTQEPGVMGMISHIDFCAGVCYGRYFMHVTMEKRKSFVQSLIDKGHMRPLEFGTVYLKITSLANIPLAIFKRPWCYINRRIEDKHIVYYITTNYRYIIEEQLEDVLQYWCEPTKYHVIRKTFKLICSRAIADEFRTHISLSHLMQSTRYCKFDTLNIIKPRWYDDAPFELKTAYRTALLNAESSYRIMMSSGAQPQQSRGILPLDVSTTLLMCGTINTLNWGWDRFFKMRISDAAAPEAKLVAEMIKKILDNANK